MPFINQAIWNPIFVIRTRRLFIAKDDVIIFNGLSVSICICTSINTLIYLFELISQFSSEMSVWVLRMLTNQKRGKCLCLAAAPFLLKKRHQFLYFPADYHGQWESSICHAAPSLFPKNRVEMQKEVVVPYISWYHTRSMDEKYLS